MTNELTPEMAKLEAELKAGYEAMANDKEYQAEMRVWTGEATIDELEKARAEITRLREEVERRKAELITNKDSNARKNQIIDELKTQLTKANIEVEGLREALRNIVDTNAPTVNGQGSAVVEAIMCRKFAREALSTTKDSPYMEVVRAASEATRDHLCTARLRKAVEALPDYGRCISQRNSTTEEQG